MHNLKCLHCDNTLPVGVGFAKIKKDGTLSTGKLACCVLGCKSHGLRVGSKQYRHLVLGTSLGQIESGIKAKTEKMALTRKRLGIGSGDLNPMSKKSLADRGLSPEEIDKFSKARVAKTVSTKRTNGFYSDKANNPFSYDYWGSSEKVLNRIINRPEFWKSRGFSNSESELKSTFAAKTNSIEYKVNKYGIDLGTQKYADTCKKISNSWNPASTSGQKFGSSKAANKIFKQIYKLFRRLGILRSEIYFSLNGGEWFSRDKERIYFYDFVIPKLKIAIEFNGTHVHPNPEMSEGRWSMWKHAYSGETSEEVHKYNTKKMSLLSEIGYNILILWSDSKNNIDLAKSFIRKICENPSEENCQLVTYTKGKLRQ